MSPSGRDHFRNEVFGEWLCGLPQVSHATQCVWYCLARSQILLSLGFLWFFISACHGALGMVESICRSDWGIPGGGCSEVRR